MQPKEHIDQLIAELKDWRGETFADLRRCVLAADPEISEEWKWMGSPVWSRDGCAAHGIPAGGRDRRQGLESDFLLVAP